MNANKTPKVMLASMPWAKLSEPSLGLSILKSVLRDNGINHEVKQFNIQLLRYLKAESYSGIADINGLNEFLFTQVFEDNISPQQLTLLSDAVHNLPKSRSRLSNYFSRPSEAIDYFLKIRNQIIPKFLNNCVQYILQKNVTMVGLTCLFDQTIASLALAKLLKEKNPSLLIALGGYALEGEVGLEILKRFHCVDVIAFGDGEPVITKLANASVGAVNLSSIPNIAYREGSHKARIISTKKVNINIQNSPTPDFTDFFRNLEELKEKDNVEIINRALPIETSRGCWWGQKHHCVFCGIDENTLVYRQKAPYQVLDLLLHMRETYPDKVIRIIDYILPHNYFKTLLPELTKWKPKLSLTCETKSNLNFDKFRLFHSAGFKEIQPGIESFSTPVLRKMRKGVSGIQNILTLKLGKEFGIKVHWNLLYGFPNDEVSEYAEMVEIIPHLYHFDPPHSCTAIFLTRFAPLEADYKSFNLPKPYYHGMYDLLFSPQFIDSNKINLNAICYFFEPTWQLSHEVEQYYKIIEIQVDYWRVASTSKKCLLYHENIEDGIQFIDNRMSREDEIIRMYSQDYKLVYELIHYEIKSRSEIVELLKSKINSYKINKILDELIDTRIIYCEGNQLVGLSISKQIFERNIIYEDTANKYPS